jgi:dolichol-phosphate mannosyltransferase
MAGRLRHGGVVSGGDLMAHRYLIVIPAYNEEASIEEVVKKCQRYADVCVVNDASTDATPQILASIARVHCIHHQKNTHIAGAILDGMRYAFEAGYDFCITMDAGMSHNPDELDSFKARNDADLVIGSRVKRVRVPFYRKALSFGAKLVFNHALRRKSIHGKKPLLKDVTSGYRMYSRQACSLLLRSKLKSRSFDFHLEALACVYRSGMQIVEVPITYTFANSSLRWKIVGEALRTWWRIYLGDHSLTPAVIGVRQDGTTA